MWLLRYANEQTDIHTYIAYRQRDIQICRHTCLDMFNCLPAEQATAVRKRN